MELSDYDLLGITPKATFRIVKNAYYELSRIYHPDSSQIIIGMTKKDREIAFQRIQTAYENIKEKMNVVEVDLPESDIEYKVDYSIKKIKEIEIDDESFNEKFNKEFEKVNTFENDDNPFSIYYKVPEESKRNLPESKLIIKGHTSYKNNNIHEFGINYIEDHSCENYYDIRHLNNSSNLESNESNEKIESIKEEVDTEFDKKLEELIKMREVKIEISEDELNFMNRQKRVQREIEESKIKVTENRNKLLITTKN